MTTPNRDWPANPDHTPVAEAVRISGTLRQDEPVAVMELFDVAKDHRVVQLTEAAVYDVIEGLTSFLAQLFAARRAEAKRRR